MINAFKFTSALQELPNDDDHTNDKAVVVNKEWYESGIYIIYPESRTGIVWSLIKTISVFISMFTLSYTAGFRFQETSQSMRSLELFFDIVQLLDIILTCFTA